MVEKKLQKTLDKSPFLTYIIYRMTKTTVERNERIKQ